MIAYLDNSATTKPLDSVIDYMAHINREIYGNPSSLHSFGFEAEKIVKKARETILCSLGDAEGNVVFTAGGTEANNIAIIGSVRSKLKRRPHIITGKTEHPSVTEPFLYLKENGAEAEFCPCKNNGQIDLDKFAETVTEKTELVSLMLVNNEVGAVLPVLQAAKILKSKSPNAIFHVDAVQGFGKVPINVKKAGIDMLSISAHKINGPKGIGALYIKKGVNVKPVMFGGHQENNLRSGTHNVPAIGGFSLACEAAFCNLEENAKKMNELKNYLLGELKKIPFCKINGGEGEEFAPNIINASFDKIRSEIFLHALEKKGVFVSSGSACSSNKPAPSHVLLAMGFNRQRTDSAVRLSLSAQTTFSEVEYAAHEIIKTANELYGVMK